MILGDHMFSFFFQIIISIFIIFLSYYILSKKEIGILETLVLLFLFHVCIFSFYNERNILEIIFISILILLCYFLYTFLYQKSITKNVNMEDKVLINRGIINFKELIKEHYSYDNLLLNLKKKGIENPNLVDYCIKKNNDLIVFRKNSIKNYPISIIIDGEVLKDNLFSIHKSVEWLEKKLEENNLELDNINYAYFKNKDVYFITNLL